MRATTPTAVQQRKSPAFAWLALVALALFQVAAAGHDSRHVSNDLAETCAICAHLDDVGTPVASIAVDGAPPRFDDHIVAIVSRIDGRRSFSSQRPRGPPHD